MELRAQTQSATMKKMRHFDICKNNNLAPPFSEKDVENYFLHFERVIKELLDLTVLVFCSW